MNILMENLMWIGAAIILIYVSNSAKHYIGKQAYFGHACSVLMILIACTSILVNYGR